MSKIRRTHNANTRNTSRLVNMFCSTFYKHRQISSNDNGDCQESVQEPIIIHIFGTVDFNDPHE